MEMHSQIGESLVLIGEAWTQLRYKAISNHSLRLRSKVFATVEGNRNYEEGVDFIVDYDNGKIKRTSNSHLPDWSNHVFYNQTGFDHTLYEKYSNEEFTVYVDYEFAKDSNITLDETLSNILKGNRFATLKRTIDKLKKGESIKYLVYGDSISTGAEASLDEYKYFNRFADRLRQINPEAKVEVHMKAIGGEASRGGVERLQDDVISLKPDLVSIGYGMNDQNKGDNGGHSIEPVDFEKNIVRMVEEISSATSAEIVLLTACIPNPLWKWSSGDAGLYADIIRKIGLQYEVAVADVQAIWLEELKAGKDHSSLLLNNINHPNDYGHWLYYKTLESLL